MLDCFPCFKKSEDENINNAPVPVAHPISVGTCAPRQPTGNNHVSEGSQNHDANNVDSYDIQARSFTFRELATATKNFRQETLLGECASGRIYKGTLHSSGEVVSVKRLDKNRTNGNKEFLVEVHMLSLLRHSNLLNLVGYCADGDQRLLVYEFMPMGSVERCLLDLDAEKKSLDWSTRMKIACGTAQGIEYLHNEAKPPIIYRDLKCSNIMLDDEFNPKLSDYGLSKLAASTMSHMTVMGNQGYSAPEYEKHGEVTMKSDVYSFGVVLLELISGRRALDTSKPAEEQHLVAWAQPIFRNPKRFPEMADPRLNNSYPVKSLNQVVGVAAMCLQDEPDVRPLISDVVASLGFLANAPPEEPVPETKMETSPNDHPACPQKTKSQSSKGSHNDETDQSEESSEFSESEEEKSFDENHHEQKDDFMDEPSDEDLESESSGSNSDVKEENEQEKENHMTYSSSFGRLNSLEYEVASMSSSSCTSDDESPHGHTNKRCDEPEFQSGNSSSRMKCKSTKIPKEEQREGAITGSRRMSRKRSSGLDSKGMNNVVLENENIGSYARKSSNAGKSPLGHTDKRHDDPEFQGGNSSSRMKCKSTKTPKEERREGAITGSRRMSRKRSSDLGSKGTNDMRSENENIGSHSRKSNNAGSDNAFYHEKNHSISSNSSRLSTSSDSSQSSSGGSGDEIVISGHHKDNEGIEDELL